MLRMLCLMVDLARNPLERVELSDRPRTLLLISPRTHAWRTSDEQITANLMLALWLDLRSLCASDAS